jgi:hypothetical protein
MCIKARSWLPEPLLDPDEQAAVASLWRALVVWCFGVTELGRDVGLA